MSLLRGILDSKGRREIWQRNNAPPPQPTTPEQPPVRHDPQPGPDGTVLCCGYTPMTPAAHALHLKGQHLPMTCGRVLVAGLDDPWLIEADARLKAERNETPIDDDAIRRAELVEAYYDSRSKRQSGKVAGASDWMTD